MPFDHGGHDVIAEGLAPVVWMPISGALDCRKAQARSRSDLACLGGHADVPRNMLVDGNIIYLGMASPMNLRTDSTGGVPTGSWELSELTVG